MTDLLDVLDGLRAGGISFTLRRPAPRFELVWSRSPTPEGEAYLEPWAELLLHVAVGRHTGHAPARCSSCGAIELVPIVSTSGTSRGRKSAPWQRCRSGHSMVTRKAPRGKGTVERLGPCEGVMVVRDVDLEGVARIKPPGVPQLATWQRKRGLPVTVDDGPTPQPWPGVDDPASRARRIERALELGVDPDHIERTP